MVYCRAEARLKANDCQKSVLRLITVEQRFLVGHKAG